MARWLLPLLFTTACVDGVTQVAGIGSVYTTRCSAEMEVRGVEYFARCDPPPCEPSYHPGPVGHVVVALDPGRKIVGYAERTCIQDLSQATALFQPALEAQAAEEAGATP